MATNLIETLDVPERLALSYAPPGTREDILTLLLLDARMASILRNRGEPIITQIKLAWWRDRLRENPAAWPSGEPLLARLTQWMASVSELIPLVDGWEALLADSLTHEAIDEFAHGRARAWQALAAAHGCDRAEADRAARDWSLVDLAIHIGTEQDAARVRTQALEQNWRRPALPRALRPLLVLHRLAGRALRRGSRELLDGPGAGLVALRVGVTGR